MTSVESRRRPQPEQREHINNGAERHMLFICDNNRTWAQRNGLTTRQGYAAGAQKMVDVADYAADTPNVEYATIIVVTKSNLDKRPPEQLDEIWDAVRSQMIEGDIAEEGKEKDIRPSIPQLIHDRNVQFRYSCPDDRIPKDITQSFEELSNGSKKNTGLVYTLVFGYDAEEEMRTAVAKAAKEEKFDWENIDKHRLLPSLAIPEVTSVVRTGEEMRTSGYFPYDIKNAEYIFREDIAWPEYGRKQFTDDIRELRERTIKRGG